MRSRKSTGLDNAISRLVTDLNDRLVIVEGKRDVAALGKVGVRAHVLTLDKLQHMERITADEAVILTDFDRAGEAKLMKAESILIGKGIRIDTGLRERFRRIFGITTIEDLPHAFEKLAHQ
ncbi:MAG: toprim domain-containing protein [Candidatus Micrarchaeia archaeon]